MKILKHRNLLGCLFAVILAMPLINVGVRCAYTVFNKNAKDSYSGSNQYENRVVEITTSSQLIEGIEYNTYYVNQESTSNGSQIKFSKISLDLTNAVNYNNNINYVFYRIYAGENRIYFYNEGRDILCYLNNWSTDIKQFAFTYGGTINYSDRLNTANDKILLISLKQQELDNAFSYSISQVTEGNNIGELKFFTWFADLFLDLDNSSNALYINFINWYFNYALLVSAVYILFLALMWFIQWVRRLLERGMDFGNRGY